VRFIAGDQTNLACFWADRYCQRRQLQKVESLIPLAAHTILSAGSLNSAAIDGLEIVVCDDSGIRRLSDDSIIELQNKSREWDEQIGNLILGYTQKFTYAPHVIG
jgi:hypothetical protein